MYGGKKRPQIVSSGTVSTQSDQSEAPIPVDKQNNLVDDTPKFIQWSTRGSNLYYPEFQIQLTPEIPTGYYSIAYDGNVGKYFVRKTHYITDNILELPMTETGDIIKDITTFWDNEDKFHEYGLTYKRGVLMYGPPGCGKSHIIQLIIKYLINDQKGVVFKIETADDVQNYSNFMQSTFKIIENNRRIVTIIEDIDGLFQSGKATETLLLNILDGMGHMDNIVYVATTNHPEELEDRVINRPSRFDRRYKIDLPNDAVRRFYFENTLKEKDLKTIDLDLWVKESDKLSIAHLREIIVSTIILGNPFEKTMAMMKDLNEHKPTSKTFGGKGRIGFGS